jgi:hypothetical protein
MRPCTCLHALRTLSRPVRSLPRQLHPSFSRSASSTPPAPRESSLDGILPYHRSPHRTSNSYRCTSRCTRCRHLQVVLPSRNSSHRTELPQGRRGPRRDGGLGVPRMAMEAHGDQGGEREYDTRGTAGRGRESIEDQGQEGDQDFQLAHGEVGSIV